MSADLIHPDSRFGPWSWGDPRHGEHFRRCSYCGSIHPDDLAAEQPRGAGCVTCGEPDWNACFDKQTVAAGVLGQPLYQSDVYHRFDPGGWYAQWADRKYGWPHKFYVDLPNRDPERLYVISASNHMPQDGVLPRNAIRTKDLTRKHRKILRQSGWQTGAGKDVDGYVQFGTHAQHHAKFYTIHLADPSISDETLAKIADVSGLRFHFTEQGGVSWHRAGGCEHE